MRFKKRVCLSALLVIGMSASNGLTAQNLIPVERGWANNSVNTTVFRKNSLVTHDSIQFISYYDPDGFLTVGKRNIHNPEWTLQRTRHRGNVNDAHNSISIMVDGDGYLHVAWDHHGHPLRYAKGVAPLSLELGDKQPMTGLLETNVTYPEFFRMPGGDLIFMYRDGESGKGNLVINHYNLKTKEWTQKQHNLLDGESRRNAYWQACVDSEGIIHLSWVWRETWDVATNHDLCYARSSDGGSSWEQSDGTAYALPITLSNAEYICHIPQDSELINQTSITTNREGEVYIASYWREAASDVPQYHIVYSEGKQWKAVEAGFRKTPFSLKGGGTKRIPISRPQVVVDGEKVVLFFRDEEREDRASMAICRDLSDNEWSIQDLTDFSVGSWEPSCDTELWKNKGMIHLFVQHTEQVDGEGKADVLPQTVYVLEVNKDKPYALNNPDYKISPLTGMTRQHWADAAEHILKGAFAYIRSMDNPMKFPKQFEKTYPRNEEQVPTEKLEGFCRTLFVAAPLLKEKPDLVLNQIPVAEYYRYNLLNLINPESPSYIKPRGNGGPSQILVEFGALAISLSVAPEILWQPLTQEEKDGLAEIMLSYGDGPTIGSNWRFFNIFILSFFKDQGYNVNEKLMLKYLDECLEAYRGYGWYNDSPAYDYYSMWAFQMYGPVWSHFYGNKYYPEYAAEFMRNLSDMAANYPYMFSKEGKMNMWGRSIPYRFGSVIPLALTGYLNDPAINYGWMRRIASGTILQFVEHPAFLEDGVPTLGFYGPFEPAVQIYSCRGSVYWAGKAFLALLLPPDNPFWTAKENNGPWGKDLKKDRVYNKFQPGSNLLITDYPNSGAAEMRSWCHETVANDWQKFRSTENYNKLAYNTEFPWMADGKNGEISMNYGVYNKKGEWEVLRLYTFKSFEDGVYRRDAQLETNRQIEFRLADIPLPNGILRVDKVISPVKTDFQLGHYALPELQQPIVQTTQMVDGKRVYMINNGAYQLAMISLEGWKQFDFVEAENLHPVSKACALIRAKEKLSGEKIFVTLQLWKKGGEAFSHKELSPVKKVVVADDQSKVEVWLQDGSRKTVSF